MEVVKEKKKKQEKKRSRSSDSKDEFDKPEWEEVTIEQFEKIHGKYEEVEVEFEVKVIEEFDYKTINNYLTYLIQNKSFDSRKMTDIILKQEYLGSCIRQAEDEDCFGFITAINLNFHKSELFVVQIQNFIINNAPGNQKNHWNNIVYGERIGLLISERLVNIPNGLVPSLHETIYEEIQWAIEDRNDFEFENIIYITMFGHDDPEGLVLDKQKKRVKKDKEEKKNWFKVEDPIYLKYSTAHFTKSINHSETKMIMQIPMNAIPKILKEINETITEFYLW